MSSRIITVHVKPGSRQKKLEWMDGDTVRIWVTEPPEKGKANKAVQEMLSEALKIAPSLIRLTRGAKTSLKQFEIDE